MLGPVAVRLLAFILLIIVVTLIRNGRVYEPMWDRRVEHRDSRSRRFTPHDRVMRIRLRPLLQCVGLAACMPRACAAALTVSEREFGSRQGGPRNRNWADLQLIVHVDLAVLHNCRRRAQHLRNVGLGSVCRRRAVDVLFEMVHGI